MRWASARLAVAVAIALAWAAGCASLPASPPDVTVSGVVRDAAGAPLDAVTIFLERTTQPGGASPAEAAHATTGADGRFTFHHVGRDRYQLLLTHARLGWLIVETVPLGREIAIRFDGKTRVTSGS